MPSNTPSCSARDGDQCNRLAVSTGRRGHGGSGDRAYREGVNSARKELVIKALRKTDGNRAAAARLLGLETKYFFRLMKSLGIE